MIEIQQIRKDYNGTRALDGLTLRVESGELFGLVGPNGAGKTTLIKILATLLVPSGGSARVNGLDVVAEPEAVRRIVGYMPDQPGLYQDMRVREFLEFFADAFRLKRTRKRDAVERALQRCGLADRSASFVEELSLGLKQRLLLGKTLLHQPKVLLLDEPATGLDPLARIDLRQQLKSLNAEGVTILVSSHILADLEDICSRVALISGGRNAPDADGNSIIELRQPGPQVRVYEVEVVSGAELAPAALAQLELARLVRTEGTRLLLEIAGGDEQAAAVLRQLVTTGVGVARFDYRSVTLEQRYKLAFGVPQP